MFRVFFFESRIVLDGSDIEAGRIPEKLAEHFGDQAPDLELPADSQGDGLPSRLLRKLLSVFQRFIESTRRFRRR